MKYHIKDYLDKAKVRHCVVNSKQYLKHKEAKYSDYNKCFPFCEDSCGNYCCNCLFVSVSASEKYVAICRNKMS